jgi:hypothetical protein
VLISAVVPNWATQKTPSREWQFTLLWKWETADSSDNRVESVRDNLDEKVKMALQCDNIKSHHPKRTLTKNHRNPHSEAIVNLQELRVASNQHSKP